MDRERGDGEETGGESALATAARSRAEFMALLGRFRRTPVLVPLTEDADGRRGWWLTESGGVQWICAFSDEAALARFALARGEGDRAWDYQRVLGARLLDVAVPMVDGPCGVALDAADGDQGVLFPPVAGVVPEAAVVDGDEGAGAV